MLQYVDLFPRRSLVSEMPLRLRTPPGGILADEMGLGKTVEVLACILNHPRSGLPPRELRPAVPRPPELRKRSTARARTRGPPTPTPQTTDLETDDLETASSKTDNSETTGTGEVIECICGAKKPACRTEKWATVQCESCGLWQHPDCVRYDLSDVRRGRYLCPHCHVAQVRRHV